MKSNKMHLCVVSPSHWTGSYGGSEQQIRYLLELLITDPALDITYVAYNLDETYIPRGYKVKMLSRSLFGQKAITITSTKTLYDALSQLKPDVIYQRVGCAYTGVSAYYARKHHINMVWHVSSDANVVPLNEVDNGGMKPGIEQYIEKKILEYGVRNSTRIITQTYHQSELLQKYYHREADRVVPNYQIVPTENIDKNTNEVLVLWVSNIKPMKQPEVFLNLARSLQGTKAKFVMVGRIGQSDWSNDILTKINQTSSVNYLGELTQRDVDALMCKAHILVNTSCYEGFPNTFIQAWMRLVPVVSLRVNPDNVLEREKIGYCSLTYENLVESVRKLITDVQHRNEYGSRAKQYAEKNHSMINREAIIEEILKWENG